MFNLLTDIKKRQKQTRRETGTQSQGPSFCKATWPSEKNSKWMVRKMRTKIALSMLVILFVIATSLGATMAWFTDSETLENTFTAGTLAIDAEDNWKGYNVGEDWEDVNPGDCKDKEFRITNTGSKHSLIRLQFDGEWGEYVDGGWVKMDPQDSSLVTISAPAGWTLEGDWWYYNQKLSPNMDPNDPFTFEIRVCVDGPDTGNEYQGMSYKLDFTIQAIQASNNASGDKWLIDSVYSPSDPETAENWSSFDFQ